MARNRYMILVLLCASGSIAAQAHESRWGHFGGPLRAEFERQKRDIVLLQDFVYTDPSGEVWKAPAGARVDGASIPQIFWSVIGGPLDGNYREASVIHDVACQIRDKPWERAHRAFYYAMRCGGVGERRAKIMYFAVYHFGPRWGIGAAVRDIFTPQQIATNEDVRKAAQWIRTANPNLDQIEKTQYP